MMPNCASTPCASGDPAAAWTDRSVIVLGRVAPENAAPNANSVAAIVAFILGHLSAGGDISLHEDSVRLGENQRPVTGVPISATVNQRAVPCRGASGRRPVSDSQNHTALTVSCCH